MTFWMGCEGKHDVADAYRCTRNALEAELNQRLAHETFSGRVTQWALVPIISPKERHEDYPEITDRRIRKGVAEFRLFVDHAAFLSGDDQQRRILLIDMLRRSITLMPKLGVPKEDCDKLESILDAV
jgi:Immunity protein 44